MSDEQVDPDSAAPRSVTGLYETLLELGRGGMGTVHLARAVGQAGFERLVVLKRMHAHMLAEAGATERFVDESRIAAQLHHANIVGIQHVGADEQGYFLVFDYIEGESLQALLEDATSAGQGLPLRVVLRVVLDALSGLHAAHTAEDVTGQPLQILHRDVSPHNLLVGRDGSTRLADFGIARDVRRTASTTPGLLVGKTLYMPPEYLRGGSIDVRLDVYGMGVSAWVALAGGEPWPNAPDPQVIYTVMNDGFPALSMSRADLPPEIEAVVMRALARDPDDRYPSARAMADALGNAAQMTVGIANGDEVGALVEQLCGRDLSARRRRIAEATSAGRERSARGALPLLLSRPARTSAPSPRGSEASVETRSQEASANRGRPGFGSGPARPVASPAIDAVETQRAPAASDASLEPSSVVGTVLTAGGDGGEGRGEATSAGRERGRRRRRAMIGVGAVVALGAGLLLVAARAAGPGDRSAETAPRAAAEPSASVTAASRVAPSDAPADIAGVDPSTLPAASAPAPPAHGGRGARARPGASPPAAPPLPPPAGTPPAGTPPGPPPAGLSPPPRPNTNGISSANPYR